MIMKATITTIPSMRIAELTALLHLASPALPIGAFSYSQGLEAAIEAHLITGADSAREWIASGLTNVLALGELPFLAHQIERWRSHDVEGLTLANSEFLASRESAELRREGVDVVRGRGQCALDGGVDGRAQCHDDPLSGELSQRDRFERGGGLVLDPAKCVGGERGVG